MEIYRPKSTYAFPLRTERQVVKDGEMGTQVYSLDKILEQDLEGIKKLQSHPTNWDRVAHSTAYSHYNAKMAEFEEKLCRFNDNEAFKKITAELDMGTVLVLLLHDLGDALLKYAESFDLNKTNIRQMVGDFFTSIKEQQNDH